MKQNQFLVFIISIIFLAGCSGPKVIAPVISNKAVAENEMAEGNYMNAMAAWKKYFEQTPLEQVSGAEFASAAQTAFKAGDLYQATGWYDQARYKNFVSAEMYATLAQIYHSQKNLSKELSALEYYSANYSENIQEINKRLFEIYYEIDLYDKALEEWRKMDESSKTDITDLKSYFKINKKLEKAEVCDSVSLVILKTEPENIDALEWNAEKYYWLAENRYQREMEKYNSNKTNRQYKILLGELDLATADFKRALPYFEKLWKIEPGEKYASYFANIYARFGDEAKVNYYKKYIK